MNKRQSKLHKKKLLTGDAHLFAGGGGAVSGAAASGAAQGAGGFNWQQFMGFFNNGNQQGGQGQGGQQMQGNGFSNVMNSQGMKTVNRVLTVADKAVDDYKEGNGNDYLAMAQEMHQNSSSGNPIFDAVGQSVDLTAKTGLLIDKVIEGKKKRNRMSLEEKIGTFADGGHLFAGGGSATPDTVGDVAGTVAALAGNAVNQAKIKNTDAIEKKITNSNTGMYSQGMSFDDLSNQWGNLRQLRRISYKDLRGNSLMSDGLNAFSAGNQGAQAGFKVGGPWGAAIGGVVGTASSLIGSLIGRHKAKKKAKEINKQIAYQNDFNQRTLTNNLENVSSRQTSNLLANFAAYGGPLEYDLQKTYLDNMYMNAQDSKMSAMPNSFQTPKDSLYTFGFGGDLSTHGGDWSNGLTWINNGGTHEENPQQGVPIGVAPDGEPNLVEEGEVVFNDYVFSNRIKVPEKLRQQYHLKEDATFADAAKKASKESEERPNDPISKNGLFDSMEILKNAQEEIREEKKVKQAKREAKKQADAQMAMGINPMQQQMMLQQPQMPDQLSQEQMAAQELTQQGNGAFACGGHLHGDGDYIVRNADGSIDYDKSVFGLNEVTVTAKAKKKDPLLNDMFIQPLSVGEMSLPQQQVLIRDAIQKQEMARRKRDYLLGKSADWFKCGGHLKGGDDYTQYLENGDDIGAMKELYYNQGLSAEDAHKVMTTQAPAPATDISAAKEAYYVPAPKIVTDTQTTKAKRKATTATEKAARKVEKEKTQTNPNGTETLPTWMRYAPVAGAAIGLGLSYLPTDYSNAERLENAAKGMGYDRVSFNPIGNYLTYNPFDINYTANQLRAAEQANARNILNTAGGNSGNAMAGLLANNYNSQLAMANAYRQAEEYNLAQRQKVEDFNRGTNMTNSQGFLDAAKANQAARAQTQGQYLSAIETAAKMRQLIDDSRDQSRAANLSSLFNSIGDIGKENMSFNMVNTNRSEYYGIKPNGEVYFKDAFYNLDDAKKAEVLSSMKRAEGGYLTRKNKKSRR